MEFEFSGQINQSIREEFKKRLKKTNLILNVTCWIIMSLPLLFIVLLGSNYILKLVCVLFGICETIMWLTNYIIYRLNVDKAIEKEIPTKVTFEKKELIRTDNNHDLTVANIEEIKTIIDEGAFYLIKMYFPYQIRGYIICQKDLITKGTIEEFEEIFKEYIVRKPLKTFQN